MITKKEAKKLGISACIEKLGYDFCTKYAGNSTSCWGMKDEKTMYCYIGVNTEPEPDYDIEKIEVLTLDLKGKFPYSASCLVNMENSEITFLKIVKNNMIC